MMAMALPAGGTHNVSGGSPKHTVKHPGPADLGQLTCPPDLAHLRVQSSLPATAQNSPTNANTQVAQNHRASPFSHFTSSPTPSPHSQSQPRKPSPGLAARLKALGFGTSRQASPPLPNTSTPSDRDRVGRLPEDQLKQLDHNHQAGSATTVVERRGRPWRGAIARIPSIASLKSNKAVSVLGDDDTKTDDIPSIEDPNTPTVPDFLPEIEAAPPIDMDTNKYRLPDHTNGNSTKVQLDTRQQHLERGALSPSSVDSPSIPPPPLPKDTPPLPQTPAADAAPFNPNAESYFNPLGLQRPGSIYTLSRASFANQLAQLTSIQLPDAELLSNKVTAIPTAEAAARALIGAANQIRMWITKASEVIGGLDSDDDVEWAAAGGREGYEEVENAISRFEELINVYVGAIEALQRRADIANVSPEDLTQAVVQMDAIMAEWGNIRATLQSVKGQVEIAMEWEELWNLVLGEIQNEMDELSRLVFEMEERRHKSILAVANGDGVDIGDLETIVEETPPRTTRLQVANQRFSLPAFPASPSSPGVPTMAQDDSSLLALFARMQPLRASLDFLPMRLSGFEARAKRTFPTACDELEMRREGLDAIYKKLENDAESLRKELGEDRWVIVFRGAGRQAQKMYESVDRSVSKLKEGVDAGMHLTNQPTMAKKIESYETKKTHYGPAIERVLSIIDKGVKDRLTVNGEILRLHAEMQAKWEGLKERIREMDLTLEEIQSDKRGQQLRDSISSMLSNDRSTIGSGHDTPQSSPPSSVIMSGLGIDTTTPTNANKRRSTIGGSGLPQPRRAVSATGAGAQAPRQPILSRYSSLGAGLAPSREGSVTPVAKRNIAHPTSTLGNRPRWNNSTIGSDTGHNFKPLSLTTPSPYAKKLPTPIRSVSSLGVSNAGASKPALRSPLGRSGSASPIPEDTTAKAATNRLSFRERIASAGPGPYSQHTLNKPRLTQQASMSSLPNRRASLQPPKPNEKPGLGPRPASSLAADRRSSMLPTVRPGREGSVTGDESPQALAGAKAAMRKTSDMKLAERPRWRG